MKTVIYVLLHVVAASLGFAPSEVVGFTFTRNGLHIHDEITSRTSVPLLQPIVPTPNKSASSHLRLMSTGDTNGHNHNLIRFMKASLMLTLTMGILTASTTSTSAMVSDSSIFNGDYADPFHPLCERHLDVSADGTSFHYSGTAVGPKDVDVIGRGCSAEEQAEFRLQRGAFDGTINVQKDGKSIVSAGDGIHEGIWEYANSVPGDETLSGVDQDGIRWNDGNKWVKLRSFNLAKAPVDSSSGMNPTAKKAVEWGFVIYVVFSLAAGAKEMTVRFQRYLKRNDSN